MSVFSYRCQSSISTFNLWDLRCSITYDLYTQFPQVVGKNIISRTLLPSPCCWICHLKLIILENTIESSKGVSWKLRCLNKKDFECSNVAIHLKIIFICLKAKCKFSILTCHEPSLKFSLQLLSTCYNKCVFLWMYFWHFKSNLHARQRWKDGNQKYNHTHKWWLVILDFAIIVHWFPSHALPHLHPIFNLFLQLELLLEEWNYHEGSLGKKGLKTILLTSKSHVFSCVQSPLKVLFDIWALMEIVFYKTNLSMEWD